MSMRLLEDEEGGLQEEEGPVEEARLGIITVTRKAMLQENVHFHEYIGVHIIEWILMQLNIVLNLLLDGRDTTGLKELL